MNAYKITLLGKLLGVDSRQFIIPIYQRKYKWTQEQCDRLIDDIVKAGKSGKEHFTGTVVYNALPSGSFTQVHLVDGQQRVTTTMLMLKALQMISLPYKDSDADYLYVYNKVSSYMYADKDDPNQGLKLIPSENDANTFNLIINSKTFEEVDTNDQIVKNEDNHLFNNFKSMYLRLKTISTNGDILRNVILSGMMLLTIVEMSLDKEDDPQAIFESINSLGLKLSNADLIRNYLLMSNLNQETLYKTYWKVIQDTYIGENNMESFVFNYLMMKKSYAINTDDIYKEYVQFAIDEFKDQEIDKEALLKDLYLVAKIYQPFIKYTKTYSADTNMLMQELRDMVQTTAYPFLMKVFLDKESSIIDENTLDKVINLIIVYLVRRTICGVPTHSLRGFMLNLYNRIFKVESNKKRYFESVYAFLSQLETNDRLRKISEVSDKLEEAEIYKNVKFATYLLYKIENGRYPKAYSEFTLANSVSVEHIMPQTLTDEWTEMLGDDAENIHSTYLNTLGNLSLSSRSKNSIMSNESFVTKRDVLMTSGSKFIELNKDIKADQTVFAKKEILDREERLSKIVCSKYDIEDVDVSGIKFEDSVEIVCSTDYEEVFNSTTPIAYKLFGKETPVDSFSKIIVGVAKVLLVSNPEKMRELAGEQYNPWEGGERDCIHYTIDENDKDQLIGEGIRVHTNYNAVYCVQFATLLMEKFGVDASQLIIYLKKDSVKSVNVLPKKERVRIVRQALEELKNENIVVYEPSSMPKSDDWIKFQTTKLNELFPYEGKTKWDGEDFGSISYLEYHLSTNKIHITYKIMKKTSEVSQKLLLHKEELKLNDKTSTWWHMKSYKVDYEKVVEAENKVLSMKEEILSIMEEVKEDLNKISIVLNN